MRKLLRRSLNNSWSLKEHIALWRRNYKCLFQLQEWKREKKKKKKKKEGKGQSAVLGVVDISPLMGNSTHARQNDAERCRTIRGANVRPELNLWK